VLGTEYSKGTYSPFEAAEFLGISEEDLENYTRDGQIRIQVYGGRRYYLGGELDSARGMLFGHTKFTGALPVSG